MPWPRLLPLALIVLLAPAAAPPAPSAAASALALPERTEALNAPGLGIGDLRAARPALASPTSHPSGEGLLYHEDFDDGDAQAWWFSDFSLWRIASECFPAASQPYHLAYNLPGSCTYDAEVPRASCGHFDVDLTGHPRASLSWMNRYEVEPYADGEYDVMRVYARRADASEGTVVFQADSTDPPQLMWKPESVDVSRHAGGPVTLSFCFDTVDGLYNTYPGWFVDNVAVFVDAPLAPGADVFHVTFDDEDDPELARFETTGLWRIDGICSPHPDFPVFPPTAPNHLGYHRPSWEGCTYQTGAEANRGDATFPVSLRGLSKADLSFYQAWDNEGYFGSYDRMYVDVQAVGGAWVNKFYWDSTMGAQRLYLRWVVPLDNPADGFLGNDVLVRFRFDTVDGLANDHKGWHIDDVRVTGA